LLQKGPDHEWTDEAPLKHVMYGQTLEN